MIRNKARKAQWPRGQCACIWIEQFRFKPWPGTLCCFLGQDNLLSQCLSQVYTWRPANLMLGVTLQWASISSKGVQKYFQLLRVTETRISYMYGLMGLQSCIQAQPLTLLFKQSNAKTAQGEVGVKLTVFITYQE